MRGGMVEIEEKRENPFMQFYHIILQLLFHFIVDLLCVFYKLLIYPRYTGKPTDTYSSVLATILGFH